MAVTNSARQADYVLASLPTRPPTPPKEQSSRVTSAPLKPVARQSLAQQQSLQTPPNIHSLISPATTESNTSSGRLRKRVEWSAHTEYKEAPQYLDGERLAKSSPVAASTASRPIKGILKATSSPCQPTATLNTRLGSLSEQVSISEMLDSTIKQLSGADRDSKVDAYMTLARALKTSNNLPDRVALQGKLSLLTQFIQRDITLKTSHGALDRSLVNHALLLLTTFLHFNAIASTISSDFAIFITDHAIRSFEDARMPKEVVRYLMQVMAFQSFAPKVMSHDRVGRLVAAIHRLEGQLSGKSIVMSRIQLYKRLVKQCPHHMVAHANWLQDLFTDMLSLTKDIRAEAISLGMEAGFQFRHDKQVSRHVLEILQTETDERSFIQYYIEKLQEMLKDRDRSAAVPQIWAVVNLFMRYPLERWELYGPWLTVVQTAFNTADGATKLEANHAWSRYVYLCLSEGKLSSKSVTTLCQPLLSQLRKKANPKNPDDITKLRRAAIGGTCNLFYYSFRPGNDKLPPDMIWDVAVQPIISQLITLGDNNDAPGDWALQAARLLNGLLDGGTPRVWREDRIKDNTLIRPDELPPLDPKWIRRNSQKVFKILDAILERKALDLANQDSLVYRLWQSLVGAIAAASAKDIKVSDDTVKFFASSFGLLYKIWSKGTPSVSGDSSRLLKAVSHMVQIMVNGLGVLPFTEKKLSMTTPNFFEAITTPSARVERQDKTREVVRSPLLHLLNLFCTIPEGVEDNEEFSDFILSTFEPFFAGKAERARVDQARDLLLSLPRNIVCPYGIWILASQSLLLPFTRPGKDDDKGDKVLGPEYRELISFLERGLTCHPNLPMDRWLSAFKTVDDHVVHHFGQAGRVLVMIEPMAKFLIDLVHCEHPQIADRDFIVIMTNLLATAQFPKDRQAMDAARRYLWGAAPPASQHGPFKPFDSLYKAADLAMHKAYKGITADETQIIKLLESTTNFVAASSQHGDSVLPALQHGVCSWIEDQDGRISFDSESYIGHAVKLLWHEICQLLIAIGTARSGRLDTLEPTLSSGFGSKHQLILIMTAETWNRLVGDADEPQCSDSFKSILSSVNLKLDVEVAGTANPSDRSGAQLPISLGISGSSGQITANSQPSSELSKRGTPVATPSPPKTNLASRAQRKKRDEATPRLTRSRVRRRAGTPRLRHDNSQIEFTAVTSSPSREESQHLTERQEEVRERQKTAITAWPMSASEVATTSMPSLARSDSSTAGLVRVMLPQRVETTPEPRTSYEDLISSTPTPRRGQVLQMDDLNDPPSSPPELRPYPLLSEIQTRSKAGSSLEGWEFSSPPNSPGSGGLRPAQSIPQCGVAEAQFLDPSTEQDDLSNVLPAIDLATKESSPPNESRAEESATSALVKSPQMQTRTRCQKRKSLKSKDVEEEIPPSIGPSRRTLRSHSQDDATQVNPPREGDTSFSLSEEAESNMIQVIVALESGSNTVAQHASPMTRRRARSSPTPSDYKFGSDASLRVQTGHTKKRRYEEAKEEGARKKRVKSKRQNYESQQADISSSQHTSSPTTDRMPTRRSKRVRRELEQHGSDSRKDDNVDEATIDCTEATRVSDDAGDTDEELLSQLMADSQAASQSQSQSRQARSLSTDLDVAKKETQPRADEKLLSSTTTNAASAVMSLLCSSKEMLRGEAISRQQVDELEVMIMDLKREIYQAEYRGRE
ncbi:hypothetical protein NLU13_5448 [Sarocladium strictum]|uniref:Telomere-associated protein Rif1 N-terminal domain-containing protein n=1 Tax=Sarocladium strictum TaxID=5046 RepID=A0AA39GGX5_SARSR|nr:hypothetical protein NLU13_5448 [Sarocladium strictum]